jgi:hypothetical protein
MLSAERVFATNITARIPNIVYTLSRGIKTELLPDGAKAYINGKFFQFIVIYSIACDVYT